MCDGGKPQLIFQRIKLSGDKSSFVADGEMEVICLFLFCFNNVESNFKSFIAKNFFVDELGRKGLVSLSI